MEKLPQVKFMVDGQVVLTSQARSQRTIVRILERLASAHVGREVSVEYPGDKGTA